MLLLICKICKYRYTVSFKEKPIGLKKFALVLYSEGLGFRSIERIINVSNVTVMRWIKSFGKEVELMRKKDTELEVIEIDEMHAYIGSKKLMLPAGQAGIWIAVDRFGKKFINFVLGTRGKKTGRKLWDKIKDKAGSAIVATDHWAAYEDFVPAEQHIQSKAKTYTVEGYNSILRHSLVRMRRKSKCYTKSEDMVKYSIILLFEKRNNGLPILT